MSEQENKAEPEVEEEVPRPSFKLSYFPFAGDALALRLAAYISGLAYTDEFVEAVKQTDGLRWVTLPELALYGDDNKELLSIGESNTCLRYVGCLAELYPSNPLAAALCDEVLDSVKDTQSTLSGSMATKEGRSQLISKDGALTYWLKKFESRLEENQKRGNDKGYIVGDTLSIADLKLFELFYGLWLIFELYEEDAAKTLVASYPMIEAHYTLINSMESVQTFIQRFLLRNSEYKLDPQDQDIKLQTYKGKFVAASL